MSGIRIAALRLGVVLTAGVVCGMPLLADGKSSTDSGKQPQTAAVGEETSAAPEPGELGNPRSSYKLGSARSLEGKNLIYSLFVDTPDAEWTDRDKKKALKNLEIAKEYIEAEAKDYHKKVDLVVDFEENEDLTGSARIHFSLKDGEDYEEALDEEIAGWLEDQIDYEALTKEYKAKGIATIVFVNHKGSTYAICYDGVDNPQESLVMFAGEVPAVYAHEILHLFGAHDLYEDAEYTEEVCEYVKKAYPDEIMYTVKDEKGRLNNSEIQNELSPVTAYHLGWVNYIEEIDVFPQLKR
mgnify:FL=1